MSISQTKKQRLSSVYLLVHGHKAGKQVDLSYEPQKIDSQRFLLQKLLINNHNTIMKVTDAPREEQIKCHKHQRKGETIFDQNNQGKFHLRQRKFGNEEMEGRRFQAEKTNVSNGTDWETQDKPRKKQFGANCMQLGEARDRVERQVGSIHRQLLKTNPCVVL